MQRNDTWWEEFKNTDWFSRILLVFPYLLAIYAVSRFFAELFWGPF